jgi:hypothetical protein
VLAADVALGVGALAELLAEQAANNKLRHMPATKAPTIGTGKIDNNLLRLPH